MTNDLVCPGMKANSLIAACGTGLEKLELLVGMRTACALPGHT